MSGSMGGEKEPVLLYDTTLRDGAQREGLVLSGTALMTQGLALPLTHPETAWIIVLEKIA